MDPDPVKKLPPAEPEETTAPRSRAPSLESMTIELHRLIREGQGDSNEADALRERMYEIWEHSSAEERALMDGLSGDLYMLAGEEVLEDWSDAGDPPIVRLQRAWEGKAWGKILLLLRYRSVRDAIPEDVRACFRGRCWSSLGYSEAAFCFFDHAVYLSPPYVGRPSAP